MNLAELLTVKMVIINQIADEENNILRCRLHRRVKSNAIKAEIIERISQNLSYLDLAVKLNSLNRDATLVRLYNELGRINSEITLLENR